MNALVAAAVLLPATAILALALLVRSRTSSKNKVAGSNTLAGEQSAAAVAAGSDAAMLAAAAAAAAAAAEAVQRGSCGKLVSSSSSSSSSGNVLQLELPALHRPAAHQQAASCCDHEAGSRVLPVTAGRPQLQPLVEGWLAMLRQLPRAADRSGDDKEQQKTAGCQPLCAVYAVGPVPLVADAQVLCGGMEGVHFVQKTYQL
jgi:hypothetical protein